jgi:hypothetical protein
MFITLLIFFKYLLIFMITQKLEFKLLSFPTGSETDGPLTTTVLYAREVADGLEFGDEGFYVIGFNIGTEFTKYWAR